MQRENFSCFFKTLQLPFVICFHKNFSSIIKIQKVWKQIIKKKVSLSRKKTIKQKFFYTKQFYLHAFELRPHELEPINVEEKNGSLVSEAYWLSC